MKRLLALIYEFTALKVVTVLLDKIIPVGTIVETVAVNCPPPCGIWVRADGSVYAASEYETYVSIVKPKVVDGKFKVPDKGGRVSIGANAQYILKDGQNYNYGGDEYKSIKVDNLPAHSHTTSNYEHRHDVSASESDGLKLVDYYTFGQGNLQQGTDRRVISLAEAIKTDTHSHTINSTGSGLPLNVVQPYIVCDYYIRLK